MSDVNLRAVDICRREVSTARSTDSVIESYREMAAHHYRSLPVVDADGILHGMLALQDLLTLLIPAGGMEDPGEYARQVTASTEKIAQILEAEVVTPVEGASIEQVFLMMVAGSSEPVMQDRIGKMPKDQLLHHHGRPGWGATPCGRGRGALPRHHERFSPLRGHHPRC